MKHTLPIAVSLLLLAAWAQPAAAQKPDFSGRWELDSQKSTSGIEAVRQGAGKLQGGRDQLLQRHLAEVFAQLTSDAAALEIEQTERDIKIFDRADNVNIYYVDGKKHRREEPGLGSMETKAEWQGDALVITSESNDAGEGVQTFSMDGDQLLVQVRVDAETFENEIVADFYYDRAE